MSRIYHRSSIKVETPQSSPNPQKSQTAALTNKLLQVASSINKTASPQQKQEITKQLIAIASKRKGGALEDIKTNPKLFLESVIPQDVRNNLPEEVQTLVEKQIEIKGTLSVAHFDNFKQGKSNNVWTLSANTASTKTQYQVYFAVNPPPLSPDKTVYINGVALDNNLVVDSGRGKNFKSIAYANTKSNVLGESTSRKLLTLLVKYEDEAEPFAPKQIGYFLDTSPNSFKEYYNKVSSNQLDFSADVTDWYTIPKPKSSNGCRDFYSMREGLEIAQQNAVDISSYSFFAIIFPNDQGCHYAGAIYGSLPNSVFINYYGSMDYTLHTIIHEAGHSFTLSHAGLLSCGSNTINTYNKCDIEEYGDPFDVMGAIGPFQFNAAHMAMGGWLNSSSIGNITEDGTYTVSPLEGNSGTRAYLITRTNDGEQYWIEYRRPIGIDATIPEAATNGILIHLQGGNIYPLTVGTDITRLVNNRALPDGQIFEDKVAGIKITQISHGNNATFQVQFESRCLKGTPKIEISPEEQIIQPGQQATYALNVTNNDSSDCDEREFSINGPTGVPAEVKDKPDKIQLRPGETKQLKLYLTPNSDIQDGIYSFQIYLTDNQTSYEPVKAKFTTIRDNTVYRDPLCSPHDNNLKECDATKRCAYFLCTDTCWPKGTSLETGCTNADLSQCNLDPNPPSQLYDCSNGRKCYNDFKLSSQKCEIVPKINDNREHFHCDQNTEECAELGTGWVGSSGCGSRDAQNNQVVQMVACGGLFTNKVCWSVDYRDETTQCKWHHVYAPGTLGSLGAPQRLICYSVDACNPVPTRPSLYYFLSVGDETVSTSTNEPTPSPSPQVQCDSDPKPNEYNCGDGKLCYSTEMQNPIANSKLKCYADFIKNEDGCWQAKTNSDGNTYHCDTTCDNDNNCDLGQTCDPNTKICRQSQSSPITVETEPAAKQSQPQPPEEGQFNTGIDTTQEQAGQQPSEQPDYVTSLEIEGPQGRVNVTDQDSLTLNGFEQGGYASVFITYASGKVRQLTYYFEKPQVTPTPEEQPAPTTPETQGGNEQPAPVQPPDTGNPPDTSGQYSICGSYQITNRGYNYCNDPANNGGQATGGIYACDIYDNEHPNPDGSIYHDGCYTQ